MTFKRRGEQEPADGGMSSLNEKNSPFIGGSKIGTTSSGGGRKTVFGGSREPGSTGRFGDPDSMQRAQASAYDESVKLASLYRASIDNPSIETETAYQEALMDVMRNPALAYFIIQAGVIAVDVILNGNGETKGKDTNENDD